MDENAKAKKFFIDALFDELEEKGAFIEELAERGRRDEAMMLCCVYLDGFANRLSGHEGHSSARAFCEVLIEHGGEPTFGLLTLARLDERIEWSRVPKQFRDKLRSALEAIPAGEALNPAELSARVSSQIPTAAQQWLEGNTWRLSLAHVAYTRLRCPNVHELGSAGGISFSATTRGGMPIPGIDLGMLQRALKRILIHARAISAQTNKFFGRL